MIPADFRRLSRAGFGKCSALMTFLFATGTETRCSYSRVAEVWEWNALRGRYFKNQKIGSHYHSVVLRGKGLEGSEWTNYTPVSAWSSTEAGNKHSKYVQGSWERRKIRATQIYFPMDAFFSRGSLECEEAPSELSYSVLWIFCRQCVQAIVAMVQRAASYLEDTPDLDTRNMLVETLNNVCIGKVLCISLCSNQSTCNFWWRLILSGINLTHLLSNRSFWQDWMLPTTMISSLR